MKNTAISLLSATGLLLTTGSAIAHSGHSHNLFHTHDNTTLMTASLALVLSSGIFIGYKLITARRATAKVKSNRH